MAEENFTEAAEENFLCCLWKKYKNNNVYTINTKSISFSKYFFLKTLNIKIVKQNATFEHPC